MTGAEHGVDGPMRIRAAGGVAGWWARVPWSGRVFVVLAVADIGMRAAGLFGMRLFLDATYPLAVFTTFLPHDGLILLPALALAGAPDLRSRMPTLWLGVIVLGVSEFVRGPVEGLATNGSLDPFSPPPDAAVVMTLLATAGWLLVARGLRTFETEPWLAALANLSAIAMVVVAVMFNVGAFFALEALGPGESHLPLLRLNALALILGAVATGYVVRALIRGSRDARRPPIARAVATAAGLLLAANPLVILFGRVMVFGRIPIPVGDGPFDDDTIVALLWLTESFAWSVLVCAFGLGLGRATRDPAKADALAPDAPKPSGPAWPEPGGDVPSYAPPDNAISTLAERARARRAN